MFNFQNRSEIQNGNVMKLTYSPASCHWIVWHAYLKYFMFFNIVTGILFVFNNPGCFLWDLSFVCVSLFLGVVFRQRQLRWFWTIWSRTKQRPKARHSGRFQNWHWTTLLPRNSSTSLGYRRSFRWYRVENSMYFLPYSSSFENNFVIFNFY